MELNKIWNEDNLITMSEHIDDKSVDIVLTSPFYNSTDGNKRNLSQKCIGNGISVHIGGFMEKIIMNV